MGREDLQVRSSSDAGATPRAAQEGAIVEIELPGVRAEADVSRVAIVDLEAQSQQSVQVEIIDIHYTDVFSQPYRALSPKYDATNDLTPTLSRLESEHARCPDSYYGYMDTQCEDLPEHCIDASTFRVSDISCKVLLRNDGLFVFKVYLDGLTPVGYPPSATQTANIEFIEVYRLSGPDTQPEVVASLARDLMVRALVHELDENIKVRLERPFEPHHGPYKRLPW